LNKANSNTSDLAFLKVIARYIKSWLIFFNERFSPLTHIPMIVLFCFGTATFIDLRENLPKIYASVLAFLFFFRLRLFDEIKDYELDIVINPTRPLPRGLLSTTDLKFGIIICTASEYFFLHSFLPESFRFWLLATIWSFFMYKEFFISSLIKPHLTTYATTHTFVTLPLTLSLISGMNENATIQENDLYVAIGAWFVFNIFELGRKIFTKEEERSEIESYSKIWGQSGSVILVLTHSLLATLAFIHAYPFFTTTLPLYIPSIILTVSGLFFLFSKNSKRGSIYRLSSSIYIILIYLLLTVSPYMGSHL